MKRMLHGSCKRQYIFRPQAIKGARIISCNVSVVVDGAEKSVFEFWDPFLITAMSLNAAHEAFCGEKHKLVRKGVFPHTYVHKVGVVDAFGAVGAVELNIESDFPPAMRSHVQRMIENKELECGSVDGNVMFDLVKHHDEYVESDVVMMEDVYESLSELLMKKAPKENLLVTFFPTVASMSFYLCLLKIDPQVRGRQDNMRIDTQIFLMNRRLEQEVREGMYGGRCINRVLEYISSQYDLVLKAIAMRFKVPEEMLDAFIVEHRELLEQAMVGGCFVGKAIYKAVTDALAYLDMNGMYHYIMQTCKFPYGMHMEVRQPSSLLSLLRAFEARGDGCDNDDNDDFPMFFMRLDVYPNPHENESCLPSREKKTGGRLRWDNQPKIQQVYNCAHLRLAVKRGFRLEAPTWAIVWGSQAADGSWHGKKCRMFKEVMDEYEMDRNVGGSMKDFGKLCANTTGGAMAKRDFMVKTFVFAADRGQEVENLEELDEYVRNPDWKCTYSEYSETDERVCLVRRYKFVGDEENVICKRAPQMWGYIMSYAHVLIEEACEGVFGASRRMGLYHNQPMNGDTDSLFLHWEKCVQGRIKLHPLQLGSFSDDLKKLYCKDVAYEEDEQGRPLIAKVIHMSSPQKKLYALTCILPNGMVIQTQPKSKGIGKQKNMNIMMGIELDAIIETCQFNVKVAMQHENKSVRLQERMKLEQAVAEYGNFTTGLTTAMLIKAARNPCLGGIVAVRRVWKSHGFTVAPHLVTKGVQYFSKECQMLTRRVHSYLKHSISSFVDFERWCSVLARPNWCT